MEFQEDSSTPSSSSDHYSPPRVLTTEEYESHLASITPKRKAGRKKFRETRHPVYKGVRQRNGAKWVCEVREPHKKTRIWLGTFPTPEMAARAYDVAALALRGKSVPLNFPDSAWVLPRAKSSLAKDIQVAALEAAEAFRPVPCSPLSSSSSSNVEVQRVREEQLPSPLFLDEEALYNMPGLLTSMAEGLLLSPPMSCTVIADDEVWVALDQVESMKKLLAYQGKCLTEYQDLYDVMGEDGTNGERAQNVGQLVNDDNNDIVGNMDNINLASEAETILLTQDQSQRQYVSGAKSAYDFIYPSIDPEGATGASCPSRKTTSAGKRQGPGLLLLF
ncbi:hypothetical protein GIB67_023173 [Kingdonia uniflora]|uniref:AP2/ERF domain-containing protein n=1 Tax=Kingdonia uniflora TaxID=39325 RepID=A0A7J7MC83_9MAGN|nr:hypothetical protein GIB67_023173 [Kingdonia uniflora]